MKGVGAVAGWPLVARAQSTVPIIGLLSNLSRVESSHLVDAMRLGLREAGYVESRDVVIEYYWAEGQNDRLPDLIANLIRRSPAVIVAIPTTSAQAVKAATATIPVVFGVGSDPVRLGLVASLNRPGGNVTGVSFLGPDLEAKRLGLLHQLIPQSITIAVLVDPRAPNAEIQSQDLKTGGRAIGRQILVLNASVDSDLEGAFATLVRQGAGALVVTANAFFFNRREQLVALATRHAVPAIFEWRECALAGGLISYGTNLADSYRQMGRYAGRILKGENPAELPIMQPTKFDLVLNLKTAKALGLTIPASILAIANEVIE
jgi:putative ABC transport system substrate-binding protein